MPAVSLSEDAFASYVFVFSVHLMDAVSGMCGVVMLEAAIQSQHLLAHPRCLPQCTPFFVDLCIWQTETAVLSCEKSAFMTAWFRTASSPYRVGSKAPPDRKSPKIAPQKITEIPSPDFFRAGFGEGNFEGFSVWRFSGTCKGTKQA